jgi:hypothetical protein
MGYSTASTEWPSAQTLEEFGALIDKFFALLDSTSDDVGDQLADEVFTSDGQLAAPAGKATGSAGKRWKK